MFGEYLPYRMILKLMQNLLRFQNKYLTLYIANRDCV